MPTCQNCQGKWTWKQTIRKTMTLDPGMICPYCEEKQFQTQKSKNKAALLTPIVLFPLLLNVLFDVPTSLVLGLLFALGGLYFVFYPRLIKLNTKEEFPFSGKS